MGVAEFLSFFLLISCFVVVLPHAEPCESSECQIMDSAFKSVKGFDRSNSINCNCSSITEIILPSKGLSGTVSWMILAGIANLRSVDLSNNSIQGSIPGGFWSKTRLVHLNLAGNQLGGSIGGEPSDRSLPLPVLETLNLSNNRFTAFVSLSSFKSVKILDVSGNRISNNSIVAEAFDLAELSTLSVSGNKIGSLPTRLKQSSRIVHLDLSDCGLTGSLKPISFLPSLTYLDVSNNSLTGSFPGDFPPTDRLTFLDVSFNRFSGYFELDMSKKYGADSFTKSGLCPTNERAHHRKRIAVISAAAASAALLLVLGVLAFCLLRKKRRSRRTWVVSKPPFACKINESGPFSFQTDSGTWIADIVEPSSAAVVMFEKPLLRLTFADLLTATSRFGRESLLAGSRSGPVYRAVLPGEIHVAIKVLKQAEGAETEAAAAKLGALGKMKHPNLLPLLGYCIAGQEKLLLYEFMANGNLHQWLHELPTGSTNVEDWSMDTWEQQTGGDQASAAKMGWITRHRIAVGLARGLAYLHHAGAKPIVHGRLSPFNIFLDGSFEPRISDFGLGEIVGIGSYYQTRYSAPGSDPLCPESDVYSFGVVLLELITGKAGSMEMVAWVRSLVREQLGIKALDPNLKSGSISSMIESLRVGYLCTAESAKKRPTMQQVVGLLKDMNPC
ncbi:calmodulin-binding receptor kinase CaMRLK-like [Nymphaea colorata]|nr:calmodulin-binding receptor kinase CaMRLK-like [Nymphaea colorata]